MNDQYPKHHIPTANALSQPAVQRRLLPIMRRHVSRRFSLMPIKLMAFKQSCSQGNRGAADKCHASFLLRRQLDEAAQPSQTTGKGRIYPQDIRPPSEGSQLTYKEHTAKSSLGSQPSLQHSSCFLAPAAHGNGCSHPAAFITDLNGILYHRQQKRELI